MRKILIAAALLVVALAPAAVADSHESQVSVIHGIPDLDVDVYANGDSLIEGFTFGTVAGPLTLPEGDYLIEIYAAGADAAAEDPALSTTVTVPGGIDASVVAHLDADGNPTVTTFVNNVDPIDAGNARATVRHTAAAPAVDILASGVPVFENVSNGEEGVLVIPATTVDAAVVATGTTEPAVIEASLPLTEGANNIVYAVGSLEADNLSVIVQLIEGLGAAPAAVSTGTGGAADSGTPLALIAVLGIAAVALAGSGAALIRSRVSS